MPDGSPILAHTEDVLRQVEGENVVMDGWVDGDSWFGSVTSCIELRKNLSVHSTFVVKNNTNFFPMRVLHKLLQVRFCKSSFWTLGRYLHKNM